MSFKDDIKGQNTQLYPVVEIDDTWYSTNNVTVEYEDVQYYCKPILMNIPSIKESVDVESRRFKISNVSLQFNNFPFEGVRFSDQLSETSLINKEATIYFKSQSELKEVFKGIIRRLSHDDEKVSVDLEDLTEKKAHKNLPSEYIGETSGIPDKYKNKPIPMVYGHVDRSPLVLPTFTELNIDSREIDGILPNSAHSIFPNETEYSLYMHDDMGYSSVVQTIESQINDSPFHINQLEEEDKYGLETQWSSDSNIINIEQTKLLSRAGMQIRSFIKPSAPTVVKDSFRDEINADNLFEYDGIGDKMNLVDSDMGTKVSIESLHTTPNPDFGQDEGSVGSSLYDKFYVISINRPSITGIEKSSNIRAALNQIVLPDPINLLHTDIHHTSENAQGQAVTHLTFDEFKSGANGHVLFEVSTTDGTGDVSLATNDGYSGNWNNLFILNSSINDLTDLSGDENPNDASISFKTLQTANDIARIMFCNNTTIFEIIFFSQMGSNVNDSTLNSELVADFKEFDITFLADIKEPLSKNFYANVNGRINTDNQAFGELNNPNLIGDEFIQNPIDIIYDLVRSEIGHENIDVNEYEEAKEAHADWKFGFTVNKKISSKKLIEDIAKSTKCFPKFKNDGSFGFNTVKDSYTVEGVDSDYAGATPIKESEVISYSFKKTKPEQIYKKVTVSYNKDYAQDSYLKTASSGDLGADSYYGIESSADAHLEFESDYIRNEETADLLASFLSEQYKNDHLIFNLKLPLQYIDLEIGDLVKFESLFQGVKAYGIDYTDTTDVNGQSRYPLFMVTSTTKNLDSVSIECMQLHHLEESLPPGTDYATYSGDDIEVSGNVELIGGNMSQAINILVDDDYDYSGILSGSFYFKVSGIERPEDPEFGDNDILAVSHQYSLNFDDGIPNHFTLRWANESDYNGDGIADDVNADIDVPFGLEEGQQITITLSSYTIPEPSSETPIGDVNNDSIVNVLDVVQMVNAILGDPNPNLDWNQADLNADGGLNILDVVQLVNNILTQD